ncbi:MAG: c-type cytochrome [Campylobacter sp.]|nr:c-type cytochrome [Campylobacter sp.]
MKFFNLQDNINLLTIIFALALVIATAVVVGFLLKKIKDKKEGDTKLSEHSWDGIGEGENGLPIGWVASFVIFIVWGLWYFLVGYPLNSFSQVGMYNEEVAAYNAKFEDKFTNPSEETLVSMGEGVFLVECIACHGINAKGNDGVARDLTNWGSEDGIYYTIMNGSKGLKYPVGSSDEDAVPMYAGLVGSEDEARAVAAFVAQEISAIGKTSHPELVEQGRELWPICAACHDEDGKSASGLGPDLTKYGSAEFAMEVLQKGKNGNIGSMPSYSSRLPEIQQRALGEYIKSLH